MAAPALFAYSLFDGKPYRLAGRVDLVYFVYLVHLVSFVQPKKPNKRNKPNNGLLLPAGFFSILLAFKTS